MPRVLSSQSTRQKTGFKISKPQDFPSTAPAGSKRKAECDKLALTEDYDVTFPESGSLTPKSIDKKSIPRTKSNTSIRDKDSEKTNGRARCITPGSIKKPSKLSVQSLFTSNARPRLLIYLLFVFFWGGDVSCI